MGDQETPGFVTVEKEYGEEAGVMQGSSSIEKETIGISTLSLGASTGSGGSYDSPCAKCGFSTSLPNSGSRKRVSPCSPSSSSVPRDHYQPKPKRLFLESPTVDSSSSLSQTNKNSRNDILRRCVSDPSKPPVAVSAAANDHSVSASAPAPAQNNLLRRCVSDPSKPPIAPVVNVGTATLFPENNAVKGSSSSSTTTATELAIAPSGVRRSIVDITPVGYSATCNSDKRDSEKDYESFVTVERNGDTFRIHLKCQCGRGCQLLVDGSDYYYKLM